MTEPSIPLVTELKAELLESARQAAPANAVLIYVHGESDNGASLADDLAKLARYFDIQGVRVVDEGLGIIGVPRATPSEGPHDVAALLELVVREVREAQQDATRQLREAERTLRRRTIELLDADRRNTDARADKETFVHKLRLAQLQTEKVKNTLSFRLGHTLIHKTKSVEGVFELPRALWQLSQDASTRRNRQSGSTGLQRLVRRITRARDPDTMFAKTSARPLRKTSPASATFDAPFPLLASGDLKRLRVAGIFDEFSAHAFAPECELISLDASSWRAQLAEARPHLLFVESAWQGAGGSWDRKINQLARELRELVQWCHDEGIPTAFWNKEDPVHFGTFLNTAALFDAVFTTDFDCIHRYREALGHDRVYVLPFAAQPRQHNPIEKFVRKDAACFAGAYYARYPERQRDFLRILIKLLERCSVEIFDRNHGKTDPDYQFPVSYRDYIVGNLPFSEIDRAYKGYRYAININSIKASQTMFARRVFELLACNTLTVSNFSRGIRVMFGDLVVSTDDPSSLAARLDELGDEQLARSLRLSGLRKVMTEHTYQDRLAYVATKLFSGSTPPQLTPTIAVIASPSSDGERAAVVAAFERQTYPHKRLVIISEGDRIEEEWIARFAPADYYGDHYLEDLALATRYFEGPVIGKAAGWEWRESGPHHSGASLYRTEQTVSTSAAIVRRDHLGGMSLAEFAGREVALDGALAIDDFHYCRGGAAWADDPRMRAAVCEVAGIDRGTSLATLVAHADRVQIAEPDPDLRALGAADLAKLFADGLRPGLAISHGPEGMTIQSDLEIDTRQYVYQRGELPLSAFGFDSKAQFHLEVTTGLRTQAVFLFFDQAKQRIGEVVRFASMNHEVEVPQGTAYVRFGVLVVGPGTVTIQRLVLGHVSTEEPTRIISRHSPTADDANARVLLITNGYPSPDALYRNAFVHRRVLDYRRAGVNIDVFCHRPNEGMTYHEFEGVDVVSGRIEILRRMLASNPFTTVLVHFLDAEIWQTLRPVLEDLHVYLWVHGAEIHPWHRRRYNYLTSAELESAKSASKAREELWNSVLNPLHPNVHMITVSRSFANEIEDDYKVELPAAQHTVIHNVIDTKLFRYVPKPAAQRKKILSIRPFASRQYANDLSIAAVVELARRSWFDELDIHIIGDGPLFDATVEPLQKYRNVVLERRFARQDEIAALHRTHGIFLCPTRWDSQGVSRDEAMASGLVPVTTRIAAVPEFVDENCGFLTTPEDPAALASAIEALYLDPARFLRMSEEAAARIRRDRGAEHTSLRELALFAHRD